MGATEDEEVGDIGEHKRYTYSSSGSCHKFRGVVRSCAWALLILGAPKRNYEQ